MSILEQKVDYMKLGRNIVILTSQDLRCGKGITTGKRTSTGLRKTWPDIIRLTLPALRSLLLAKLTIRRASQRPCGKHRDVQVRIRVCLITGCAGVHIGVVGFGRTYAANGCRIHCGADSGVVGGGGLAGLERGGVGITSGALSGDKSGEER